MFQVSLYQPRVSKIHTRAILTQNHWTEPALTAQGLPSRSTAKSLTAVAAPTCIDGNVFASSRQLQEWFTRSWKTCKKPIHPISLPVRQGSLNKFLQRFDIRQHIHTIAAQRNRFSAHPPSASEPNDNIGQRGQSCVRRTTPSKHVRKEFRQVSATFPHRSWQRQTRRDLCRQHWGGRPNVEQ
jgi:hypothetical protein